MRFQDLKDHHISITLPAFEQLPEKGYDFEIPNWRLVNLILINFHYKLQRPTKYKYKINGLNEWDIFMHIMEIKLHVLQSEFSSLSSDWYALSLRNLNTRMLKQIVSVHSKI